MAYTLTVNGGAGASLASLGLRYASAEFVSLGADKLVLSAGDNYAADFGLEHGDSVVFKDGATTLFSGKVTALPRSGKGGGKHARSVVVSGPWAQLENLVYQQLWTYAEGGDLVTKWRSKVSLMTDENGAQIDTAAQVSDIVAFAAAAGVNIVLGALHAGIMAPPTEAADQTCAALILQVLRWTPNVLSQIDYSEDPPVLNFKTIGSLTARTVSVANGASPAVSGVEIAPRNDALPAGVTVHYETTDDLDGAQKMSLTDDVAGASAPAVNVLVYTIQLRGAKTSQQRQHIKTATVPAPDAGEATNEAAQINWLKEHVRFLTHADVTLADIRIEPGSYQIKIDDPPVDADPADPPDPQALPAGAYSTDWADYGRELLEGSIHPWMRKTAAPATVAVKISYNPAAAPNDTLRRLFGNDLDGAQQVSVRFRATDAITGVYLGPGSVESGEEIPAGVAAAMLSAVSVLRYQGTVNLVDPTRTVTALPADALNLSNGRAEYEEMEAPIQSVSRDYLTGALSIRTGLPGHLSVQDFYELLRVNRKNEATWGDPKRRSEGRPGDPSKGESVGALATAMQDVQILPGTPSAPSPGEGGGDGGYGDPLLLPHRVTILTETATEITLKFTEVDNGEAGDSFERTFAKP